MLVAVFFGGDPHQFLELAGKILFVLKPHHLGHLVHLVLGVGQQPLGGLNLAVQQIFHEPYAHLLLEANGQIVGGDAKFGGQGCQVEPGGPVMLFDQVQAGGNELALGQRCLGAFVGTFRGRCV